MAQIASLIVRVGGQTEDIERALGRVGTKAKDLDTSLARLGGGAIGAQAQQSLERLNTTIASVTTQHQHLADRARLAASGLERIGGVSRLTKQELDQINRTLQTGLDAYRALGQQAPRDLQRVADAVSKQRVAMEGSVKGTSLLAGATGLLMSRLLALAGPAVIGAAIRGSITYADTLQRMADKTGLSISALQKFDVIARASGNSLDQITTAVSQMQNRLASGDKSAVAAIEQLGLSFVTLRRLEPDQQFIQIGKAIAGIQDPAERTRLSWDAFGRSGAEILPTLRSDIDKLAKSTIEMSDRTVKTLDRAGDAWDAFMRGVKVVIGTTTAEIFDGMQKITRRIEQFQAFLHRPLFRGGAAGALPTAPGRPNIGGFAEPLGMVQDVFELDRAYTALNGTIEEQATKLKKVAEVSSKAAEEAAEEQKRFTDSVTKATEKVGLTVFALNRLQDARPTATSRAREFADALDGWVTPLESRALGLAVDKLQDIGKAGPQATQAIQEASAAIRSAGLKSDIKRMFGIDSTGGGGLSDMLRSQGASAGLNFVSGFGGALGGAAKGAQMGMIAGPWGAAIGAGVGAIVGAFGGQREHKKVNDMRDAFVSAAGGLHELNVKATQAGVTLKRVLDAKTVKDYEAAIGDLNHALDFQRAAMQTLFETVNKYKFSIEELGPALQRQELDQQAQALFKDWEVLAGAGIDLAAIGREMQASINDFVQRSLAMGTEVPAAMKPMLEQMRDMGLLTDAAGNKITSFEDAGVSFTLSMSEGFRSLIDEVKKLTDAISRGLGLAIANVPRHIPVEIELRGRKTGDWETTSGGIVFGHRGGVVTTTGIQRFAHGGRVLPFQRRGTDTVPAMLTPGEIVVPRGAASAGGAEVARELQAFRAELPRVLARVVRDQIQTVTRR